MAAEKFCIIMSLYEKIHFDDVFFQEHFISFLKNQQNRFSICALTGSKGAFRANLKQIMLPDIR
jgi:hypothetical protein